MTQGFLSTAFLSKTCSRTLKLAASTALTATLGLTATQAAAQVTLEEIIVTAQKRAQSLQDVPVSVAAVTGESIVNMGYEKIEDLQFSVPNFTMTETGIGTNIFIRGIGSGINQAFEQSVGTYIDGVYYGRAQQSRAPFLDLERIEVLRGPQGILFGKNSIAGALNVITAKPTEEFYGSLRASYEPDHGEFETIGIISGPLSDTFRVRIAARYQEMDGYIYNATLDRDEPNRENWTVRGTAEWDVTDNLTATFKMEHQEFDVLGRNMEISRDAPSGLGAPGLAGLPYSTILQIFGADPSVADTVKDGRRSSNGDYSYNESDTAVLTLDYTMGDHTLTAVTGFSKFKYDEFCDCDFTGASVFGASLDEDYEQWSQEIRLASPTGGTIEYILGGYFQTSDHKYSDGILIPNDSVLVPLFTQLAGVGSFISDVGAFREANVDTDTWAGFAQVTYNATDDLHLILGGRFTHEKRDGVRDMVIQAIDQTDLPAAQLPVTTAILAQQFFIVPHSVAGSRSENKFTPKVTLQYDVSDNDMIYASWEQGFKSGGYDFRANNPGAFIFNDPTLNPLSPAFDPAAFQAVANDAFEFEDEKADTFEVGGKFSLAGGSAEINLAGFYTKYKDLQVSIFDTVLGFNVGNAAKADIWGFEADGRWQVTEELMFSGAVAYLDFEFKDYPNGQCYFGEGPAAIGFDPTRYDPVTELCDYTGQTNQLVSKWQGTLAADYATPITSELELRLRVDAFFTSAYHASQTLDPEQRQDAYAKINARVALGDLDDRWEVAVLGRNLTNKKELTYSANAPLAGSTFYSQVFYQFYGRPRSFTLQARMNF